MQQVQGDDEPSHPTAPIDLWHETGVRGATAIIETRRIASITRPHSGEFLPSKNHPMFRRMYAFKGGGVLLRFIWNGRRMDSPQDFADHSGPDILVDVYQFAEQIDIAKDGRAGGYRWKGKDETYWCSRIYGTGVPRLRLVGAELRKTGTGPDPQAYIHRDPATPEVLARLTALIGDGLDITIDGLPLSVADIRALPPGQPPPTSNFLSRFFGWRKT